jgi:hypothetical protein
MTLFELGQIFLLYLRTSTLPTVFKDGFLLLYTSVFYHND